jgi:hypothetical protein
MHPQDIDPAFGHWLAGFFDGEGCFAIGRGSWNGRWYYHCMVRLNLRADDRPTLDWIAQQSGLGRICNHPPYNSKGDAKPQSAWQVQSKAGCRALVSIFDAYPLHSKKARDYAIWREAVGVWCGISRVGRSVPGGGGSYPRDWTTMARLYRELRAVRAYDAPLEEIEPPPPQLSLL